MAPHRSMQAMGVVLVLLAMAAWGVVWIEAHYTSKVSLVTVGSAILTTGMVLAWPLLAGQPKPARGSGNLLEGCKFCGTVPVPGLAFCIRCGAYPKPKPTPHP